MITNQNNEKIKSYIFLNKKTIVKVRGGGFGGVWLKAILLRFLILRPFPNKEKSQSSIVLFTVEIIVKKCYHNFDSRRYSYTFMVPAIFLRVFEEHLVIDGGSPLLQPLVIFLETISLVLFCFQIRFWRICTLPFP